MRLAFFALVLSFCAFAHAQNWTLLGPGLSHHADKTGSLRLSDDRLTYRCPLISTERIAFTGFVRDDTLTGCQGSIKPGQFGWKEQHFGFGLEREIGQRREFAMALMDSYGELGLMAGSAWMPTRFLVGSYRLDFGVGGGLWLRTTLKNEVVIKDENVCQYDQDGKPLHCKMPYAQIDTQKQRVLVPFLMPVLSIRPAAGEGFGLNVSIMPKMDLLGVSVVPTTTITAQITYTFKSKNNTNRLFGETF